jgi:hypothetical protein
MRCSVLELENLSEDEQYRGKKVYGVSGVELGAWREAYARKDKYWIFGGLKHRVTYILSFLTGHADVHWDWDFRWVVFFRHSHWILTPLFCVSITRLSFLGDIKLEKFYN